MENFFEVYIKQYALILLNYLSYFLALNLFNNSIENDQKNQNEFFNPENLFNEYLNKEDYESALKVAIDNNLNTDLIYQLQWTNNVITINSIQDYLANVSNKTWVLEECLKKITTDFTSMYALFDHGLSITDLNEIFQFNSDDIYVDDLQELDYEQYSIQVENRVNEKRKEFITNSIENLTSTQRHYILNRQILLDYKHKLKIFEKICFEQNENFKIDTCLEQFRNIRENSYLEIAVDFAHENNWKAIEILFKYVGNQLIQHYLPILNNFPETVSPLNYQKILPKYDSSKTAFDFDYFKNNTCFENEDWCLSYCQTFLKDLQIKNDDFELSFYLNNPDYLEYKTIELNNLKLLENWYKKRALEIEQYSSLVNNSIALLQLGIKNNISNLEELKKEMEIYHMIIYDCLPRYNLGDICFNDYQKYTTSKQIDLLMCGAINNHEDFLQCFDMFLLSFLDKKFGKNNENYYNHLNQFLLNVAKIDLKIIYQVYEHYIYDVNINLNGNNDQFIEEFKILFKDSEAMEKLAIDSIYLNNEFNQLETAENLIKCLPSSNLSILKNELNLLENNLIVCNFLSNFDYKIFPSLVKKILDEKNVQELKKILKSVINVAIKRLNLENISTYHVQEILIDLLEIRKIYFFDIIEEIDLNCFIVKNLLMSEKIEILQIINQIILNQFKTDKNEIETENKFNLPLEIYFKLIHESAIDYVNTANSVNDPLIDLSKFCLNLTQSVTNTNVPNFIQKELNFIEALKILNEEFDLHLLPIQIRLFPEPKIDIILTALKSFPKAYKKVNVLLKLGQLIDVYAYKDKVFRNSKILSLIGYFAIKNQDFKHCYSVCSIIMQNQYQQGWEICYKLALEEQFSDYSSKYKLLSYALTFCNEDGNTINYILEELKNLKINLNNVTTTKSIPDLIINKTTKDFAHLTKWLLKNVLKDQDKNLNLVEEENDLNEKKLSINSLNIPSFFCDAFENYSNFKIENNQIDILYDSFTLPVINTDSQPFSLSQMLLRKNILQNNETINVDLFNLLEELSYFSLFYDTPLALNYLKTLNSYKSTEKIFDQLNKKSPISVYIVLYFYSLELCRRFKSFDLIDNYSIKDIILKAEAFLIAGKDYNSLEFFIKKYKKYFEDLVKADSLLSYYPQINVNRFIKDESYKIDTLLGLAMTDEDQIIEDVLNLASQYNVSKFDVYMSYLENLLTFSELETSEIDKKIFQNHKLISCFIENSLKVNDLFSERIYPLANGMDYDKLIIYYKILEKITILNEELKLIHMNHFKNLKKLKKCFDKNGPFLDYKQLVLSVNKNQSLVELFYNILTESNYNSIARWTINLKLLPVEKDIDNKTLCPSAIYSIWLRKKFLNNRPEWVKTYEQSKDIIDKLNPNDYLYFINFFLLSSDANKLMPDLNQRFYYLEMSLEFLKNKQSKAKKEVKQEWEKIEDEVCKISEYLNSID